MIDDVRGVRGRVTQTQTRLVTSRLYIQILSVSIITEKIPYSIGIQSLSCPLPHFFPFLSVHGIESSAVTRLRNMYKILTNQLTRQPANQTPATTIRYNTIQYNSYDKERDETRREEIQPSPAQRQIKPINKHTPQTSNLTKD